MDCLLTVTLALYWLMTPIVMHRFLNFGSLFVSFLFTNLALQAFSLCLSKPHERQ